MDQFLCFDGIQAGEPSNAAGTQAGPSNFAQAVNTFLNDRLPCFGRTQAGPSDAARTQAGPSDAAGAQAGPSDVAGTQAGPSNAAGTQTGPSNAAGTQAGPSNAAGTQAGPSNAAGTQAGPSNAAGIQAGPSNAAARDQTGPSKFARHLAEAVRNISTAIRLCQLRIATWNFSDNKRIGEGGSARVYRGTLGRCKIVAVKRLKPANDRDTEYDREVGILSRLNHPHIINLVSSCAHRDSERILVYEFMPLRTLHDWLHDRRDGEAALDWGTRMRIGAGVARGLSYLHNEANPGIIYRDLKPTNVLLDVGYHPKISDFRCAISVRSRATSNVSTNVIKGTHPYWALEASFPNTVTTKADVYSFGVLLLEIIAGTVPLESRDNRFVDNWVMKRDNFDKVPDPEMNGKFPLAELVKAMTLVNHCMKIRPTLRPEMSVVVIGMSNLAGEPNAVWPVEFNTEEEKAESSSRGNQGQK